MTFVEHTGAAKMLRGHTRTRPERNGRMKTFVCTLSLCLLVMVSAGCVQDTTAQSGQTGAKTQQQKGATQTVYVAIGASDTFGVGTDAPYSESWPDDLAQLLGFSRIHLINVGIPEVTLHDALGQELPIALDAHPNLVTIWLGVNDIADGVPANSFASDLDTMLSRLRAKAPNARIAIANIPDLTLLPAFKDYDQQALLQQVQAYNIVIASAAQRYGAILVELSQQNYNLKAHPEYISDDGLHPNDIGYQQLAKLFYKAIEAAGHL